MTLLDFCENPSILRVFLILKYIINIICVTVPAIIVIVTMISLGKQVLTGDDKKLKDEIPMIIKRVIAAFIIFMIPSFVKFAFSLVNESLDNLNTCNNNATPEKIEYYDKINTARLAVADLKGNPTLSNVEKAKKEVQKVAGILEEDKMIDYLTIISDAEVKANELQEIANCINHNGIYQNGFCTKIAKPQKVGSDNNNSNNDNNGNTENITFSNEDLSGNMKIGTVSGQSYKMVNTKADVIKYAQHLQQKGVSQNSNTDLYSGYCLGFSYTHAWGLYNGNGNYTAEDGKNYTGAGNFRTYISDSERDILAKTYEELTNNRPVIIQVNGNKAGTSRHFVTVVGFKESVKNANDITAEDLLIIDSWDAKLETMDTPSSRFLTTGAMCHKDYSGYRIQYMK